MRSTTLFLNAGINQASPCEASRAFRLQETAHLHMGRDVRVYPLRRCAPRQRPDALLSDAYFCMFRSQCRTTGAVASLSQLSASSSSTRLLSFVHTWEKQFGKTTLSGKSVTNIVLHLTPVHRKTMFLKKPYPCGILTTARWKALAA